MTSSKNDKYSINLHYIRAAIEANTGKRLTLEQVRQYLVEEKLITPEQARKNAQIFTGYGDFYESDVSAKSSKQHSEATSIARQLYNDR
jgi:hypothetical protein